MNHELALMILKELARNGVRTLALCAGARNAPFVHILEKSEGFEIIPFFDERSASFFALGRAKRDQSPVAILTTSGTAVSEMLSAGIEAHYSEVPIIFVTADRPKRLRGSGAPQAIEQKDIFINYARSIHDFDSLENIDLSISLKGPTHINVCFDEPLKTSHSQELYQFEIQEGLEVEKPIKIDKPAISLERALVVVGSLDERERLVVSDFLKNISVPVFLETTSGLKNISKPLKNQILGGERLVSKMLKSGEVENVIRIGDVPLGRYWRDLDQLKISTLSLTSKKFKGTEKSDLVYTPIQDYDFNQLQLKEWNFSNWLKDSRKKQNEIDALLKKYPLSEASFVKRVLGKVGEKASFYVGNSLPIRMVDMVGESLPEFSGNRGANGIDGQVSSAFGWFKEGTYNWMLLGDLTTLYDNNGFWLTKYLRSKNISVNCVVINNKGGKIFSRIFEEKLFQNQHELSFSNLANLWGWNYSLVNDESFTVQSGGLNLIECFPSPEQDELFWQEYDQIWK